MLLRDHPCCNAYALQPFQYGSLASSQAYSNSEDSQLWVRPKGKLPKAENATPDLGKYASLLWAMVLVLCMKPLLNAEDSRDALVEGSSYKMLCEGAMILTVLDLSDSAQSITEGCTTVTAIQPDQLL